MNLNPAIFSAEIVTLCKGVLARYNLTRVDIKTFTFSAGWKSLTINNAVLCPIHKSLLYTMIKNANLNVSLDTNPYKFRHYVISDFSLFVNGKRVPNELLSLDMDHEKILLWAIGRCSKGPA